MVWNNTSKMAFWSQILLVASQLTHVNAQSLSNCHNHGAVQFCYGPDGSETAVSTQATLTSAPSTPATVSATSTASAITAVTGCHNHGPQTYCLGPGGSEYEVTGEGGGDSSPAPSYTGCHNHGSDTYCIGPKGEEVQVLGAEGGTPAPTGGHGGKPEELNCHFHAGVEHCIPKGGSEKPQKNCKKVSRDYNVPYRIGSLFAILVTSGIGVYAPILWRTFSPSKSQSNVLLILKQFGTGVMISTAFVHLLTHAELMFNNECLGTLQYEATATSIMVAGLFVTFLMEYIGHRIMSSRTQAGDSEGSVSSSTQQEASKDQAVATAAQGSHVHVHSDPNDKLSVFLLEAGIIFHSIIIGLTLVVAGDNGYTPLFIVIIFHQVFEGMALGSRIAEVTNITTAMRMLLGFLFTITTPIGMAIGIGVRHSFNGNDKGTIVAIGTLDSFSAGILAWAALVNMWGHDWVHGAFRHTGVLKTALGLFALIAGIALMSFLGKWA